MSKALKWIETFVKIIKAKLPFFFGKSQDNEIVIDNYKFYHNIQEKNVPGNIIIQQFIRDNK